MRTALLTAWLMLLLPIWVLHTSAQRPDHSSFALVVSHYGATLPGGWWLSVNAAGDALLNVYTWPSNKTVKIAIPADQVDDFRDAMSAASFFKLKEMYGYESPGMSYITIAAISRGYSKSVRIAFLDIEIEPDIEELIEAAKVLRLYFMARQWFDDDDIFDDVYHRKVLEAAEDLEKSRQPETGAYP